MDLVDMEVVLLIPIFLEAPVPLGVCHWLLALDSLMTSLLSPLVNLGQCSFRTSKSQEEIFQPVKPVVIFCHLGYRLTGGATVLRHHIEVDQCPDIV